MRPTLCVYLKKPAWPQSLANSLFDFAQIEQYKALKLFREKDLAVFNYKDKGLCEVNKLIYKAILAKMIHQVAYSHSDPWSKLVAFKQQLKLSDQSRTLLTKKQYHQLAKGLVNQKAESWLNKWMDMYQKSVRVNLPETSGNKAIRDFFLAIEIIDPIYSNS